MSSSWPDLTVEMRIACEQKNTADMADMAADATPSWAKKWEKLSERPPCREFWNREEDKRLRQEGNSCSSRITKNTGTAHGDSNRTRCVRTGAVPEFKSL